MNKEDSCNANRKDQNKYKTREEKNNTIDTDNLNVNNIININTNPTPTNKIIDINDPKYRKIPGLQLNKKPKRIKYKSRILSFFICNTTSNTTTTTSSKIILARQYVNTISKRQLFEYATFFTHNLKNNNNSSQQKNTFNINDIDNSHSNNRKNKTFLYQTLNSPDLYIVLLTTTDCNYIEYIPILKLIHRNIINIAKLQDISDITLITNKIKLNAFDIIHLVDDIVNPHFGKQEDNMMKLNSSLKMESQNEKEFSLVMKEKENKAMDNIVKGIEEIEILKQHNLYKDNSVSNEDFDNANKEANGVLGKALGIQGRFIQGLNLKQHIMDRLEQNRREEEMRMSKCDILKCR